MNTQPRLFRMRVDLPKIYFALALALSGSINALAQNLITNGEFESDALGAAPSAWAIQYFSTGSNTHGASVTVESTQTSPFTNVFSSSTRALKLVDDDRNFQPIVEQGVSGLGTTAPYLLNFDFFYDNDLGFKATNNGLFTLVDGVGTMLWNIRVGGSGALQLNGSTTFFTLNQQSWYNVQATFDFSTGMSSGFVANVEGTQTGSWSGVALQSAFGGGNAKVQFGDPATGVSPTLYVDNYSMAVSAIPEPSTYTMLFGVAALAGAVWKRGRQRRTASVTSAAS